MRRLVQAGISVGAALLAIGAARFAAAAALPGPVEASAPPVVLLGAALILGGAIGIVAWVTRSRNGGGPPYDSGTLGNLPDERR